MTPARLRSLAALSSLTAALGCGPRSPAPASAPGVAPVASTAPAPAAPGTAASETERRPAGRPIPAGWCKDGRAFSTDKHAYCLRAEALTWDEAARRCAADRGRLALPRSAEEERAIVENLRPRGVIGGDFWIGLSQPDDVNWQWVNGDALRSDQGAWAPGEPNNSGGEHCAQAYWGQGRWNDLNCEIELPFLCRLPATKARGHGGFQPLRCPGGLIEAGGKSYCWHNTPASWSTARNACAALGGDLATPQTAEEQAQLSGSAGAPLRGGRVWLGASDQAREGMWVDGAGESIVFDHWAPGEPNNSGGEHCAELSGERWNDLPCGAKLDSLCEAL